MPALAIDREVPFTNAPFAAGTSVGNKVRIVVPAQFDATRQNISICLFMHGHNVNGFGRDDQIAAAARQLANGRPDMLFVAPRFGDTSQAMGFDSTNGFRNFVGEFEAVLPRVLEQAGHGADQARAAGQRAARSARLVLIAYSGGHLPLRAIFKRMSAFLTNGPSAEVAPWATRLNTVLLLDAVYGKKSSTGALPDIVEGIAKWMDDHGRQTVLASVYGKNTGLNAAIANQLLFTRLATAMATDEPQAWPNPPTPWPVGSASFFEVTTAHLQLLADGPPPHPIAAFMARLQ